jgi:hypothetical protein
MWCETDAVACCGVCGSDLCMMRRRRRAPDWAGRVIERDEVILALRQLPARQREVIVLRFFADLSVNETATAMGASDGAVKSYTSRALARLRTALDGDPRGESERPQSAVDRSLSASAIRGETFGNTRDNPLPELTRLAATLPAPPAGGATLPKGTVVPRLGPVRIFLIVQPGISSSTSNSYRPAAGARVTAFATSNSSKGNSFEDGTQSVTASQIYAPTNMIPATGPIYFSGPGYNIGIVPDGVARVRWVFNGRYTFVTKHRRPFAVYPKIHNNIAVAPIQRNQGFVTSVTWYSADGRVIKQLNPGSTR